MIENGIFVINVNSCTKTEGENIGAVPAGVETSQKLSQELATMSTRGQ